ncbi:hypothetical protein ABE488_03250 [Luteimonas sp. TWI662]|uniref:hypothetical protein n=1 Tax=Luteimonas sp. TWI662 TaxID=3136789 RepID=UPI003209B0C8
MKRVIEFELTPEAAQSIARRLPPMARRGRATAWIAAIAAALAATAATATWWAWG